MKRFLTISLTFIFLLNTLGIAVAMDYCPMKKEYSFSLSGGKKSCCCEKADKGNCCKSKKVVLKKIEDRYVSSVSQTTPVQFEYFAYEYSSFLISKIYPVKNIVNSNRDHAPPERSVSLNILYGSFLI